MQPEGTRACGLAGALERQLDELSTGQRLARLAHLLAENEETTGERLDHDDIVPGLGPDGRRLVERRQRGFEVAGAILAFGAEDEGARPEWRPADALADRGRLSGERQRT